VTVDRVAAVVATAPADWNDDEVTAYLMGVLVGLRLAVDHRRTALLLIAELERLVSETSGVPVELVEVLVRGAADEAIAE
jgi:hypothetical protein